MFNKAIVQLMALGFVGSLAATATAQDAGALIDVMVRKGMLKDQEAEQIRSQLSRDFAAQSSAGKLNLSSSVKELKLSGDVRLRYQYDTKDYQAAPATNVEQRSRFRLRLRVGADYKNDSGNQTMANAREAAANADAGSDYFGNYNIYINKAFIGWNVVPGVTLVGGKQVNPIYTTDMVWDGDINPTGFTQTVDIHKFLELGGLELSLRSGQLIVSDSANESANATGWNANRDAWIYVNQLVATVPVMDGVKLTVAPGFYCSNGAATTGNGNGEANPAGGATALEGLKIITAPGDVSFKFAGLPVKAQWDFAYNQDATDRTVNYGGTAPSGTDKLAWLAGFQVGENKKKGDWSLLANYRQVGLSAVDPNINDSDWALSYTNMAGYKVGFFYNLGDATSIGSTFYYADNLRKNLPGAAAGKPGGEGKNNSVQVLQVDLSVKF
jgi:polyhydroxyalkanoate synthesis regulator phasin